MLKNSNKIIHSVIRKNNNLLRDSFKMPSLFFANNKTAKNN